MFLKGSKACDFEIGKIQVQYVHTCRCYRLLVLEVVGILAFALSAGSRVGVWSGEAELIGGVFCDKTAKVFWDSLIDGVWAFGGFPNLLNVTVEWMGFRRLREARGPAGAGVGDVWMV